MSSRHEFSEYVVELMAAWAEVSSRRMFGGFGLYREGLMFALIAADQLYFKTDAVTLARFEQAGSQPFVYSAQGKEMRMSYSSAPESCLESPADMAEWCGLGFGAALRADAAKPAGKRKRT